MQKRETRLERILLLLVPVLVMLPRLLSAQFGIFDDPVTLTNMEGLFSGLWSPLEEVYTGRFRPLFWYYYGFLYLLGGKQAWVYFAGNMILVGVLLVATYSWIRRMGGNRLQAWTTLITFIFSTGFFENAYTLSKQDLLQAASIALVLWISSLSLQVNKVPAGIIEIFISSLLVLLACLAKEVGILLLPVSIALLVTFTLWHRYAGGPARWLQWSRRFFVASGLGLTAFLVIRAINVPYGLIEVGYPGKYNFDPAHMLSMFRLWMDMLSRDFFYVVVISAYAIYSIVRRRDWHSLAWVVFASLWSLIWFAILVPWIFSAGYYLLQVSLGLCVIAGLLVSNMIGESLDHHKADRIAWLTAGLASLFFLLNAFNQITNARLQLALDKANADLVNYLVNEVPVSAEVIINIQEPNEYVDNIALMVNRVYRREDLAFDFVRLDELSQSGPGEKHYLLPVVENQFYPSVRMGVFEHETRRWNNDLLERLPEEAKMEFERVHRYQGLTTDILRIACPLLRDLAYCQVPNTPFDTRTVGFGWQVYVFDPVQ